MMHAEKDNFGAYVPGIDAIPDDVTNVVATSPTEVTFTLSGAVNTNWYTYNNLSQVTPMPKAWDITAKGGAPGSGGCFSGAYGTSDHRRGLHQGVRLPGHAGRVTTRRTRRPPTTRSRPTPPTPSGRSWTVRGT